MNDVTTPINGVTAPYLELDPRAHPVPFGTLEIIFELSIATPEILPLWGGGKATGGQPET